MTTFGVDPNEQTADEVDSVTSPTVTSFTFDLTMVTDQSLAEEVPDGFSRVIGDMNYFKVRNLLRIIFLELI